MWNINTAYAEARQAASSSSEQIRKMADFRLEIYKEKMPDQSRAEIERLLTASNHRRLNAVPDLTRYPELRGMRELIEAEWRGVRDGAALTDEQWALHCDGGFYGHRYIAAGRKPPPAQCSYVYFPRSDRGPLLANNLDASPKEPFRQPDWPVLNEHLIMVGVSSGVWCDEESPEIFPAPVTKLVKRYCRNTTEAVEMLERYNFFWGPGNMMVVDRTHDVAMIEKSACRIGVRRSQDGFGFITAMTAEEPGMRAFLADRRAYSIQARGLSSPCADTRYWDAQDNRHVIMTRLLAEARREPTVEKLRQIMQYRGPDGVVCDNGDVLFPGDPPIEHTIKTTIWLLSEGCAQWWAMEGETPSFKNRKEDVQYDNIHPWH